MVHYCVGGLDFDEKSAVFGADSLPVPGRWRQERLPLVCTVTSGWEAGHSGLRGFGRHSLNDGIMRVSAVLRRPLVCRCVYTSTRNLCSCFFSRSGLLAYAVAVSGARRIIFQAVERLQFLTRAELLFFDLQFLSPGSVMSRLFCQEGNFQPLWKVKNLGQYTSRMVRVPNCFFVRNEQSSETDMYMLMYMYMYMYVCIYVFIYTMT